MTTPGMDKLNAMIKEADGRAANAAIGGNRNDADFFLAVARELTDFRLLLLAEKRKDEETAQKQAAEQRAKDFVELIQKDPWWVRRRGGWRISADGPDVRFHYEAVTDGYVPEFGRLQTYLESKYGVMPSLFTADAVVRAAELEKRSI